MAIDRARLDELRNEIGEDGFAEVVALFCEDVEEALARLEQGGADMAEHLHFLKGSALNVGLRGVGDLCREEERRMKADGGYAPDISAIRGCYAASKPHLLR